MMHADLGNSGGQPLPQGLRWAIEMLSGYDMGDVRVYYASDVPRRVGARAIARGTDIHVQAGAEDALPHEAWHVVQQMQGRVVAMNDVNGMPVNDDPALEKEADAMGAMANALSFTGMWKRAKGALAKVRMKSSVVQRAVTVGNDRYTSSKEDFEKFAARVSKLLMTRVGDKSITHFPATVMAEILSDFVMDDESFGNDDALLQEIAIRNVGYRAESAMRRLMDKNFKVLMSKLNDRENAIEAINKQWAKDEQLSLEDRQYKSRDDANAAIDEVMANAVDGFLVWGPASYLVQSTRTPMALWLASRTNDEPLEMNCWESVFYSLVSSRLVGMGYIAWANMTLSQAPDWKPKDQQTPTPTFLPEVVKIRDYYWSVSNGPLDTTDRKPQRNGWTHKEIVCIPPDFKIPRGRVVILNFASHVAISTGRAYRIASEEAQAFFGTNMGHGILELDKADGKNPRTIKETTIEDLLSMGGLYLGHVLIAPFPSITNSGNPKTADYLKPEEIPTVQEAIQRFLEENKSKIEEQTKKSIEMLEKDAKKAQEQLTKLENQGKQDDKNYSIYQRKLESAKKAIATEPDNIKAQWEKRANTSPGVMAAKKKLEINNKGFVELPLFFPYEAVDPYHGLVTFPNKK